MLFSTVFDYANGIAMEYLDRREKPQYRKWVLMLSVVVNIGILCFFKYTDFVLESVGTLTGSSAAASEAGTADRYFLLYLSDTFLHD